MTTYKILVADDNETIRNLITIYFSMKGFEVTTAINGEEAVTKEEQVRPDLVILDVEMPVMNGFDACRIIRSKRNGVNYVPIVFISGLITERLVVSGLELEANDFVTKPFEPLELLTRVNNLLKIKDFISKVELLESVIFALVKSIETRDFYTAGHSRRIAQLATEMGRSMGLSENELVILSKGSLLHDIGKLGISDIILNKTGELTADEYNLIKEHPIKGEDICKNIRLDADVLDIIRSHHEKLDGTGYPMGLKKNEIGTLVRIVTIADIFDSLTTNRPYRASKSTEEALSIVTAEANDGKLDNSIVDCLKSIILTNKA